MKRLRGKPALSVAVLVQGTAFLILLGAVLFTPGFFSTPSIVTLVNSASLVGCVAVGMSFITLSGNIMSFALGATTGATAMVFAYFSDLGGSMAAVAAVLFAILVTGTQGLIVGLVRANPIIVSIAAFTLILGLAELVSGGQTVYAAQGAGAFLKGKVAGVPVAGLLFVGAVFVGECLLRYTRFGYHVYMVGSNARAASAAGISGWRTVLQVYMAAGFFTALAGMLIATRYNAGNMEYGAGYDYSAIAAVLVGGTAISGGAGSVLRTAVGVIVIAVIEVLLLLHGIAKEYQLFLTGLIVLAAILLQAPGRRA